MRFKCLVFLALNSCPILSEVNIKTLPDLVNPKKLQLPVLDSIITISKYKKPATSTETLKANEAKALIYNQFRRRGIIPRREMLLRSTLKNLSDVVDYDTLYKITTKNLTGAVVSYWLGSSDLNGHCFQPQKALILYTAKGYKVVNEEIIPKSFRIDSVTLGNIYGEDYECGGRGTLRRFRITIR